MDDEQQNKPHKSETDSVHVRNPSTITLKEIVAIITLVASAIMGYSSLVTRLAIMEENQRAQTKATEQIMHDIRDMQDDNKNQAHDVRDDLTKKIEKIEERMRLLELQQARGK